MTRINVVPVEELTRQHLIAEYRELPRLFNLVVKAQARGLKPESKTIPEAYCLGKGHCLFFYNKVWWLYRRFFQLVEEMKRRGYEPTYLVPATYGTDDIHYEWLGDYEPTPEALALNRERINERLSNPTAKRTHPLVAQAAIDCEKFHDGQVRKYTGEPYWTHPREVVELLIRVGIEDPDMLVAGYGHDWLRST